MANGRSINWPRLALACIDLLLVHVGFLLAFWLRLEGQGAWAMAVKFYPAAFHASLLVLSVFYFFGLYNRIWVHASTDALMAIVGAVTVAEVGFALSVWGLAPTRLPYSVVILTWLLWLALIGGSRFAWRMVRDAVLLSSQATEPVNGRQRLIIYGAGSAAAVLMQQLHRDPSLNYVLVGLVDDDPFKRGMMLHRARVIGSGEELPDLAKQFEVDEVIIAMPERSGAELRPVIARCMRAKVRYRILPPALQGGAQQVDIEAARQVDIADLLGRSPAEFPVETYGMYLRGRVVLVTGAGGSIGSEICRQIARFRPERLLLVGRGENRIHGIYRELRTEHPNLDVQPIIANIAAPGVAAALLQRYSPDIVVHAAAHKHVYLMEEHPVEAIRNNVLGTLELARAAVAAGVGRFVMVSTDKAVAPTSVMGASKRLCEYVVQAQQKSPQNTGTIFSTVRFGNVIGSAGSVLTIFEAQLKASRPLTVTHPDATRFFMTIPEASLLVLQSCGMSAGGEIYVLNMGEPVRIRDLAGEMVRLYGRDPDDESNYQYIGLVAGEKLHEALVDEDERTVAVTDHIMQVIHSRSAPEPAEVGAALARLTRHVEADDDEGARTALFAVCRQLSLCERDAAEKTAAASERRKADDGS